MKKSHLLTLLSCSLLIVFFLLPRNRQWFNDRVIGYWNSFRLQRRDLNIEQRKVQRWGRGYVISKQIAEFIARNGDFKNALVLIPPTSYFKERGVSYHVPEPAVFYYYTGLKTTWINCDSTLRANWMVIVKGGKLKVIPVNDKKVLFDSLAVFNKYSLSL